MAGEDKPVPLHSQIAHYTGVLQALTSAHHTVRLGGACQEHGTKVIDSDPGTVRAVESSIEDVARLISKLTAAVEKDVTPRLN